MSAITWFYESELAEGAGRRIRERGWRDSDFRVSKMSSYMSAMWTPWCFNVVVQINVEGLIYVGVHVVVENYC